MTTGFGFAQQFPLTTQYLFNPYALTPSMAGVTGYSEIFLNYRSEWTGIEGHPQTFRMNTFGNIAILINFSLKMNNLFILPCGEVIIKMLLIIPMQ